MFSSYLVNPLFGYVLFLRRFKPYYRYRIVQYLGGRFAHHLFSPVPDCTFNKQTVHIDAVFLNWQLQFQFQFQFQFFVQFQVFFQFTSFSSEKQGNQLNEPKLGGVFTESACKLKYNHSIIVRAQINTEKSENQHKNITRWCKTFR